MSALQEIAGNIEQYPKKIREAKEKKRYSSTLFPFEEIRAEMDHIRGKRRYGGKVSIKKFIDSLMLAVDREV